MLYDIFKAQWSQVIKDFSVFIILWTTTIYLYNVYPSYLFTPVFTLLLIRCFIILHDCGHNAYTPSETLNYILGNLIGIIVMTPYEWTKGHSTHHKVSGNLSTKYTSRPRWSETVFLTVSEYKKLPKIKQILHKIFRSPAVFFIIGPIVVFGLVFRFPIFKRKKTIEGILTSIFNNVGIFVLCYYLGSHIYIYLLSFYLMAVFGFLMFHSQHTYNPPYVDDSNWTLYNSAILESSLMLIPTFMKYFTLGVEYHYIHHLIAKIPGYNLHECHQYINENFSEVKLEVVQLNFTDLILNTKYSLYDEKAKKFVTFSEVN